MAAVYMTFSGASVFESAHTKITSSDFRSTRQSREITRTPYSRDRQPSVPTRPPALSSMEWGRSRERHPVSSQPYSSGVLTSALPTRQVHDDLTQLSHEQQLEIFHRQQTQHYRSIHEPLQSHSIPSSGVNQSTWSEDVTVHSQSFDNPQFDWGQHQSVRPFPSGFQTYNENLMTSGQVPSHLWIEPFSQQNSHAQPGFQLPSASGLPYTNGWTHDPTSYEHLSAPLTAPLDSSVPFSELMPHHVSPSPMHSMRGHCHSDPGALVTPDIKMEDFDLSRMDYFSDTLTRDESRASADNLGLLTGPHNPVENTRTSEGVRSSRRTRKPTRRQTTSPLMTHAAKREPSSDEETITEDSPRRKRSYTTEDTAKCRCQLCGKLFQRTYNLRAHEETHNPERDIPFECSVRGCDRRFVRRTDLARHFQSVHSRIRAYKCDQCDASFSRKDTCRRHIEDGCPRRDSRSKPTKTTVKTEPRS